MTISNKSFFLLLSVFILFASCKKDEEETPEPINYTVKYRVDFNSGNASSWSITYTDADFVEKTIENPNRNWNMEFDNADIEKNYKLKLVIDAEPSEILNFMANLQINENDVPKISRSDGRNIEGLQAPLKIEIELQSQ
jgi:major membrane immunogen (membrane-anchored lipoprotein)